jgi:hypothetical protein
MKSSIELKGERKIATAKPINAAMFMLFLLENQTVHYSKQFLVLLEWSSVALLFLSRSGLWGYFNLLLEF